MKIDIEGIQKKFLWCGVVVALFLLGAIKNFLEWISQ